MALTKLDDVCALVVIDLQKGITGMAGAPNSMKDVIDRSARLARAFRERELPVVLVNVSGPPAGRTDTPRPNYAFPPDWTDLVPELDRQAGDHLVTKQCWGAFVNTGLDDYLRLRRVTQIVLTGIATSIGVESTARTAYDLGYNVVLATDAMTDRDAGSHRYSLEKIFPRLGELAQTGDVLKFLKSPRHED